MKTALITGITGQDGSYMAEFLLGKGYRIVGVTRDLSRAVLPKSLVDIELVAWNLFDQQAMCYILDRWHPDEFYNFAAFSSGVGMFDDAVGIGEVNGLAVTRMLEAIRQVDAEIRFCQASSREIYGEASESPQTERTATKPRSPYGAAKLYADSMVRIYRQQYGLFACSAILFNHESPRRGLNFVTRKISHEVAKIRLGLSNELRLGNLESGRDWGFAGDFVRAMWMMLQHEAPDDFVIATGETHTVREFCECSFQYAGLDYQDYVREDKLAYRPSEPFPLVGDATKAKQILGWYPHVSFRGLVEMMVEADLALQDRHNNS